ncbi:MAG: roadblock/LC7 domain-containing protein [Nostoc sp.]|uniref:roadblock/LC7 domain-containing protein n=1 Tax=Nostoc sp. TaxID=1180 RepID=UPI002FF4DE4E
MAINTDKLGSILQNFVTGTIGVQGAALVTPDGLPLAASLPGGMDDERVSAMSASMLSLGERIGIELSRGSVDRIYVEGDKGFSILTSCGQDAVLLVLASETVKQGLLMLEIKRLLTELKLVVM